jgi:hypothetical protein
VSGFHGFPDEAEEESEEDVDNGNAVADPESNISLPLPVDEPPEEDISFGNNVFSQTVSIADTSCVGNNE